MNVLLTASTILLLKKKKPLQRLHNSSHYHKDRLGKQMNTAHRRLSAAGNSVCIQLCGWKYSDFELTSFALKATESFFLFIINSCMYCPCTINLVPASKLQSVVCVSMNGWKALVKSGRRGQIYNVCMIQTVSSADFSGWCAFDIYPLSQGNHLNSAHISIPCFTNT